MVVSVVQRVSTIYIDRRTRFLTFLQKIPKTTEPTRNIYETYRTPQDDTNQMHMRGTRVDDDDDENEKRSHTRTDANTHGDTRIPTITVSDDDAGRTAAARSRTDSVRLTGRPVSCRSPSTAFIAGGWHRWVRGGRESGSALALSRSSFALSRSAAAVVPQHARARAIICRRRRKDGFFSLSTLPPYDFLRRVSLYRHNYT